MLFGLTASVLYSKSMSYNSSERMEQSESLIIILFGLTASVFYSKDMNYNNSETIERSENKIINKALRK